MTHINKVVRPVIGEWYSVPTLFDGRYHYPIHGPAHRDPELGMDRLHYHIDERFLTDQLAAALPDYNIKRDIFVVSVVEGAEPGVREMQCLREFPTKKRKRTRHLEVLRKLYSGCRMTCLKCPHRGFDLSQVRPDPTGAVHCPGHGLRWNLKTGEMV